MEDDGGALSAAITCAGLALADAGIPMYDIITASTVGVIGNHIWLDPTAIEEDLCNNGTCDTEQEEHGLIMMAKLSTHDQISELFQSGALSIETIQKANELLQQTDAEFVQIIKQILVKKVLSEKQRKEKPN